MDNILAYSIIGVISVGYSIFLGITLAFVFKYSCMSAQQIAQQEIERQELLTPLVVVDAQENIE